MGLNESGKSKHKTMKKPMKQQFSEIFFKIWLTFGNFQGGPNATAVDILYVSWMKSVIWIAIA